MSPGRARLVILFLFAVNCVLWSQSRYGTLPQAQVINTSGGLAKRILLELQHSHGEYDFEGAEKHVSPNLHYSSGGRVTD
jgi:hypothetical protein